MYCGSIVFEGSRIWSSKASLLYLVPIFVKSGPTVSPTSPALWQLLHCAAALVVKINRPRSRSPRRARIAVRSTTSPSRLTRSSLGNEPLEQVANLDQRTVPRDRDHVAPQRLGGVAPIDHAQQHQGPARRRRQPTDRRRARGRREPIGLAQSLDRVVDLRVQPWRRPASDVPVFAGGIPAIQSWIIRVARSSTTSEPTRGIRPPPSLDIR